MCVLAVFSGRALTVVLHKIIITNTFYDFILQSNLYGDLKANFSIGFILCNKTFRFIPQWSRICCCLCKDFHMHEIIRMKFSSRTLKIVTTSLACGSVTKKIMKMKKWSSQWTQFMQLRKEAWKTSMGFEPVTSRFTRCDAPPTELWSHRRWEEVNCAFIYSRERNEC